MFYWVLSIFVYRPSYAFTKLISFLSSLSLSPSLSQSSKITKNQVLAIRETHSPSWATPLRCTRHVRDRSHHNWHRLRPRSRWPPRPLRRRSKQGTRASPRSGEKLSPHGHRKNTVLPSWRTSFGICMDASNKHLDGKSGQSMTKGRDMMYVSNCLCRSIN